MLYEKDIMREARKLAGLKAKRRALNAQIRRLNVDIRTQGKALRAVIASGTDYWPESGASSKVIGSKAGD